MIVDDDSISPWVLCDIQDNFLAAQIQNSVTFSPDFPNQALLFVITETFSNYKFCPREDT